MSNNQNKKNSRIFFCLFLLSAFFAADKGYAGELQEEGIEFAPMSKQEEGIEFAPMSKQEEDQHADNEEAVESGWGNPLRNLLSFAPSVEAIKNSAGWVKENSWDKLLSLETVKDSAERVKESTQPALTYAYDTAGSALNKLSSGAGSAWGYLFGKNNKNVNEVPNAKIGLSNEDKAFLAEKVLKIRDRVGRMSNEERAKIVERVKEIANRLGINAEYLDTNTGLAMIRHFVENHLNS